MRSLTVRVTKTVQVAQYEPVTVDISETVEGEDIDRAELYKRVTRMVKSCIDNEVLKYRSEKKK